MQLTYSENELSKIALAVLDNSNSKTLCFYGQMGAGKTTLIKAMVKALGGADLGSSPTFGLVNEYHFSSGELLGFHFDFYRLNDEYEAYDMGFEDYLNQNGWIFIEWPEKIPSLIPEDATSLRIEILDVDTRKITLTNVL